MQTVILGLGNLVHSDDGVGVHAIHALQQAKALNNAPRVPPGAVLLDGGTQGLALLAHVSCAERLLVIDAVDVGEPPGTLLRFEGAALRGLPGKASVHQLGFADLMVALQLLGESPGETILLGVQPGSIEWGAELTPAVARALPALVDCVFEQLENWEALSRAA